MGRSDSRTTEPENQSKHPLHVLVVDDNDDDLLLLRERLAEVGGGCFLIESATSYADGLAALERKAHDVCLIDHYLGDGTGVGLLRAAAAIGHTAPMIMLTGQDTPELDREAMEAGASDYLVKDRVDVGLLSRVIRYALERARTLAALRASEERYELAMKGTNEGLWDWDLESNEVYFSPRWCSLLGLDAATVGRSPEEWFGRVHPEDIDNLRAHIAAHLEAKTPNVACEHRVRMNDGSYRWMLMRGIAVQDHEGKSRRMVGSQSDVSDRKEAEFEVQRSRDDLLALLGRLRIGSAITDADGRLTFVNDVCRRTLDLDAPEILGRRWQELWPLSQEDREALASMCALPAAERRRVAARIGGDGKHGHWVEFEVHDDLRDPRKKFFFLHDVTEVRDLRHLLDEKSQFHDLVGKSAVMRQLYQQIRDIAPVDSTVIIEGDTGTGKELVARAIHSLSRRAEGPFVPVNCPALSESLLASQLFGHRRGAFTGAVDEHRGLFEAASGGTLFLDEIGDIPPEVQTSLLRVLQEKEIIRVGESRPRKIDVRVITATNRDLQRQVEQGSFRLDLLYRIRVVRIHIPPLSERRSDIPLLVGSFLAKLRAVTGKDVTQVSDEVMRLLTEQPWRGNVRELQSTIEFAMVRCKGPVLQVSDLPPEIVQPARLMRPSESGVEDRRQRILDALARADGNRSSAARLLGVSRATFYRRLEDLGIPVKSP